MSVLIQTSALAMGPMAELDGADQNSFSASL